MKIRSIFRPSAAGTAARARTSQMALRTRWARPAHTDWCTWEEWVMKTTEEGSSARSRVLIGWGLGLATLCVKALAPQCGGPPEGGYWAAPPVFRAPPNIPPAAGLITLAEPCWLASRRCSYSFFLFWCDATLRQIGLFSSLPGGFGPAATKGQCRPTCTNEMVWFWKWSAQQHVLLDLVHFVSPAQEGPAMFSQAQWNSSYTQGFSTRHSQHFRTFWGPVVLQDATPAL